MSYSNSSLISVQEKIGYQFNDEFLLAQSLTHPSFSQQQGEKTPNNQRLEFLGDAVLSLVLADKLYKTMPNSREGILTRNRSALAKGKVLARLARNLGFSDALKMADAEERSGGRDRDSILEDALEAIVGAIYLDSDLKTTAKVLIPWYGNMKELLEDVLSGHNPKGRLQELIQPSMGNKAIEYVVAEVSGPPHNRIFHVNLLIDGEVKGKGAASSKKEAEEAAAKAAIMEFESGPEIGDELSFY